METNCLLEYIFCNVSAITEKELKQLIEMLVSYFDPASDPAQIPVDKDQYSWIKNKLPECGMIIKYKNEVIGTTLILPCTESLMLNFIAGKINEAELTKKIREENIGYEKMQAIYLCTVFVSPVHRGKNLAVEAFVRSIHAINADHKASCLFYWPYSIEGQKTCEKVAKILGLKLLASKPNLPPARP